MSDIKCIGVLECIRKILDISIVNTEKEFFSVLVHFCVLIQYPISMTYSRKAKKVFFKLMSQLKFKIDISVIFKTSMKYIRVVEWNGF